MLYKPDWEKVQERFKAFWRREIIDRCCVQVYAPKSGEPPEKLPDVKEPPDLVGWWTDMRFKVAAAETSMSQTYYAAEGLPIFYPNVGPDVFAAWLGADLEFLDKSTSWSVPLVEDWKDFDRKVKLDKRNRWWKAIEEGTRLALERSPGRFLVGIADLHGGGDAVAALRDPQMLAMDCIEHPAEIKRAMDYVTRIWPEIYSHFYNMIRAKQLGTTNWLPAWSPGKYCAVQCDFICMISPKMFREFFLDEIVMECNWLDNSIFHLDGPGAIKHLDDLLAIPRLDGIQWVPGAGSGPALQWIPLLRRIQQAGKCIHFSVGADEIKPLMEALSSKGLMLATSVGSVQEADELVKNVAKWTHE